MRIAIYSRKSKFTGKGESVENQVKLCRDYIERHIDCPEDELEIQIFEDEGFSGKNIDRPEFKKMMTIAKNKGFDYVICYRLDRVSRNVSDFSTLIEELNQYKISFICIKEQFDTSTPMGRAMMYIASVFAQLERETIAERIRDNLMLLARTGRWLGGTTPLGFESTQVTKDSANGKPKTSFKLTPIPDEVETVKLIYEKFCELRSLTGVETWLMNHEIKSRKGNYFTLVGVREILTNPVYCVADRKAFEYFQRVDADICFEKKQFDGKHGIQAYNRTSNGHNRQDKNNVSDWIISIGEHAGIIDSIQWVKVQRSLNQNKHKTSEKRVVNPISLLSGMVICENCGSHMRSITNSHKQPNEKGERSYAYICDLKRRSKGIKCNSANLNGNELDHKVAQLILEDCHTSKKIHAKLLELQKKSLGLHQASHRTAQNICTEIEKKEKEMDNFVALLGNSPSDTALYQRVADKIDTLTKQVETLKEELDKKESENDVGLKYDRQAMIFLLETEDISKLFFTSSVFDRRELFRSLIKNVVWDGRFVRINLFY